MGTYDQIPNYFHQIPVLARKQHDVFITKVITFNIVQPTTTDFWYLNLGAWKVAIRSTVITMNGACAGGVSALLLSSILKVKRGYLLDIPQFSSGILGGLVGITGIASSCEPWEAMLIGFIGGSIANGCKYINFLVVLFSKSFNVTAEILAIF